MDIGYINPLDSTTVSQKTRTEFGGYKLIGQTVLINPRNVRLRRGLCDGVQTGEGMTNQFQKKKNNKNTSRIDILPCAFIT